MNRQELLQWLILLASVVYVIVAIVLLTAIVVYRFQNPTLTETQLFIAFAPHTIGFLSHQLRWGKRGKGGWNERNRGDSAGRGADRAAQR